VPVKNEAHNLARCLASVRWADQIFVVDSQSTDGTAAIAESLGATVVQFVYTGSGPKKKNWALATLPFGHDWVFLLDADEVLPAAAEAEIRSIVTAPAPPARGYWINRRFQFMGRWLRHAYYPNWNMRLFQHRHGRFDHLVDGDTGSGDVEIHEHVVVDGATARLRCEMDHYAFPDVATFVEKHNRYSSWEARVTRRGLRGAINILPFRPLLRFLYVYIWQRGFLDGREGYYFARLHGTYELLSVEKGYELRRRPH
jgi:glycosyltransferase involved in cell wall biosynthesis